MMSRVLAVDVSHPDDGSPFGIVADSDIADLMAFARTQSQDLEKDCELAYKMDEAALSRVFAFSLKLEKLDDHARTYGQIIWSSLLNLAEAKGTEWYDSQVARQPKAVQQRIRDFLHYATGKAEPSHEKDMSASERADWEKLFPKGYIFGRNDPIFQTQANRSTEPTP